MCQVKASEEHETSGCSWTERVNEAVKCANCGGKHPANYKGCQIRKEIMARKTVKTVNTIRNPDTVKLINTNLSYARATAKSLNNNNINDTNINKQTHINTNDDIQTQLLAKIDSMMTLLTKSFESMNNITNLLTNLLIKLTN